ncbi:MAG: isoprenylcysteine carboxylmethyltransferase family protein [Bacteroidales bacterium]|nr:isoprenylcysteine carboxylmethyltransferase family protein [Bacteroidales bacterium]
MALSEEFERTGNWLFKHRSWIPMLLFPIAGIIIWFDKQEWVDHHNLYWSVGCLTLSMLGLVIRAATIGHTPRGTSGRNTKQGQVAEKLNTTGIYSMLRHPLYLGNFLMWLGLILYTGVSYFVVFSVFFFWIYYERIMYAEESFIRSKFKEEYDAWAKKTPPFFPSLKNYRKPSLPFSLKNVLKREYTGFFVTIASFTLVNLMKNISYENQYLPDRIWINLLLAGLVIYLTLRTLKKHTKVLHVAGR